MPSGPRVARIVRPDSPQPSHPHRIMGSGQEYRSRVYRRRERKKRSSNPSTVAEVDVRINSSAEIAIGDEVVSTDL